MPNELGARIVANYNASTNQNPQGDCFKVAYQRVNEAFQQVCNSSLPALNAFASFDRLWAVKTDPVASWLHLAEQYRGKGSAGAMASISRGQIKDMTAIWSGALLPGAVVQTWKNASDFTAVKAGQAPIGIGHSFIFLEYVKVGGVITGMKIADQGYLSGQTVAKAAFEYWVGANVHC